MLDGERCTVDLVEKGARLRVEGRGAVCAELRSLEDRRVKVEGNVAVGCREADVRLLPDGGGPFFFVQVTRVVTGARPVLAP